MPLDKGCSQAAADANFSKLYKEGYRNPQLSAIVLSTLKKACGVDKDTSSMTVKDILAAGGAKTEAKKTSYGWSRSSHEAQKAAEKEREAKKSKGLGGKLRKGFKMVFGREVKVDPVPVPLQKRKKRTEWIELDSLFEELPSSPAVRGLSFSIPGGMRCAGTGASAAPPSDTRGLAGNAGPPMPLGKCKHCGAPYNPAVSNGVCPRCRASVEA